MIMYNKRWEFFYHRYCPNGVADKWASSTLNGAMMETEGKLYCVHCKRFLDTRTNHFSILIQRHV
jgi:hypothetical protein